MKAVEMMHIFKDFYNNEVKLSFKDHPFADDPKHVWVICKHKDRWLLTKHKERGLEFPGGKVEYGESAKQAAIREVMEETGGSIESIRYVGQYFVTGKNDYVVKNVYYAEVDELLPQDTYFETEGPVLLERIPENVKQNNRYSFIMKDGVLEYCMDYIESEKKRHL